MMDHSEKVNRLRQMLQQVAPQRSLETVRAPDPGASETLRSADGVRFSDEELSKASSGLLKLQQGRDAEVDPDEALGLEAIILPRERPVFFVTDGSYPALPYPWTELNDAGAKSRLQTAIKAVGRIELPTHPLVPYGGTGFLVGEGLLMTNRHVAELFVHGLGMTRLRFNRGDAAVDFRRERDTPEDSRDTWFDVLDVVMVHPYWDMALLRVAGLPVGYTPLTLSADEPAPGAAVVAIGYPARDDRNNLAEQDRIFQGRFNVKRFQPGRVRSRERVRSFEQTVNAATHDSSTLGGNSGSAIVDPATGHVVALHFAGQYLRANYAVPTLELARDARVVAAGVRFAGSMPATGEWDDAWRRAGDLERTAVAPPALPTPPAPSAIRVAGAGGASTGASWTIPLQVTVSVGAPVLTSPAGAGGAGAVATAPQAAAAQTEAMRIPVIYDGLEDRAGFDANFLQIPETRVDLPALTERGKGAAATLEDGSHVLRYHKFSVVMHKRRRLALFTAANVDWREASRLIDGAKPSRRQLTGLADGDIEKWVTDWRIPDEHQLPDIFYTRDGGAFDKGHLVRRDDVAWGDNLQDMQMSNGDTYHTTNCSPQVGGFNQSARGEDNWGDLENMVQQATKAERAIVFSGPVLAADDRLFDGRGDGGSSIVVRVPRRFWKVVVCKGASGPDAFGFVLEQDLSTVATREMVVPARWRPYMRSLKDIEGLLFGLASFGVTGAWDRYAAQEGAALRARL